MSWNLPDGVSQMDIDERFGEPEPIFCPICGAENPDALYKFRGDMEWFGCSECIWNTLQEISIDDIDEDLRKTF